MESVELENNAEAKRMVDETPGSDYPTASTRISGRKLIDHLDTQRSEKQINRMKRR